MLIIEEGKKEGLYFHFYGHDIESCHKTSSRKETVYSAYNSESVSIIEL